MTPKAPPAFVRKWNESVVHVLCPYCQGSHTHATEDSYIAFRVIEASCRIDGYSGALSYFICYPGDMPAELRGLSYRVDKEEGLYITTGLPDCLDEDDEGWGEASDSESEAEAEDLHRFFDEYETHPIIIESPPASNMDNISVKLNDPLDKPLEVIPEVGKTEPLQPLGLEAGTSTSLANGLAPLSTVAIVNPSSPPSPPGPGNKGRFSAFPPMASDRFRAVSRLAKRSSWEEEKILFFTYCMENNVEGLKLLFTFPNSSRLMHCLDEHERPGLILAAQTDSRNAVIFLYSRGADLNTVGPCGRTALMEASLWGCEATAKILIQLGADIKLQDYHRQSALELAMPRPRNSSERKQRGGTRDRAADKRRAEISMYLRMLMYARQSQQRPATPVFTAKTMHSPSPALVGPITAYSPPPKRLTIKRIGRSSALQSQSIVPEMDGLEENLFSKKAHQLARLIGFSTALHYNKRGLPKMNSHCHVERQMVAQFIDERVIVPGEPGWIREYKGSPNTSCQSELDSLSSLEKLSQVRPRCHLLKARILVSHEPCDDCVRFVQAVNRALGVEIRLELASSHLL